MVKDNIIDTNFLHDRTGRLEKAIIEYPKSPRLHDRTGRLEIFVRLGQMLVNLHDRTGRLEIILFGT
ncbi:Heat shock protein GrpE [Moraxella catarrhalis]|nr:Heat shock protein GrpE [Moraxella catarrhalis]OAV12367.1 Heat shock protein GrpE [Moraxella catarrhalis]